LFLNTTRKTAEASYVIFGHPSDKARTNYQNQLRFTTYDAALASYSKKDYAQAIKSLQGIFQSLAQAFDAEAQATQGIVSKSSVTSDTAKQFIQQANTLLNSAKSEKDAGRLGRAYQLLARANGSEIHTTVNLNLSLFTRKL